MAAQGKMVVVTGLKELDAQFNALPLKLQKKAIRPAMRAGSKLVAADAKRYAPGRGRGRTSDYRGTGKLKRSIKVRSLKRSRTKIGTGVFAGDITGSLTGIAAWIEFGTDERRTGSGARRGRITPRSFLRRSLRENRRAVLRRFREELQNQLRRNKVVA